MHIVSHAKFIFQDTGSVPFFCWKNPGGSIRKNGKLSDHVCFVYRALFFFDGMQSAKKHALNTVN